MARRSLLRDNGLPLVLLALFVLFMMGLAFTDWYPYNENRLKHGAQAIGWISYLGTSAFWGSVFENLRSEFLEVLAITVFSIWLRQQGSPESKLMSGHCEPGK